MPQHNRLQPTKIPFFHGIVFDVDRSNSLLTFIRKRNIDAHNKIEMSVCEFIIFIIVMKQQHYFSYVAKTIILTRIPIRHKSLMIVLMEALEV